MKTSAKYIFLLFLIPCVIYAREPVQQEKPANYILAYICGEKLDVIALFRDGKLIKPPCGDPRQIMEFNKANLKTADLFYPVGYPGTTVKLKQPDYSNISGGPRFTAETGGVRDVLAASCSLPAKYNLMQSEYLNDRPKDWEALPDGLLKKKFSIEAEGCKKYYILFAVKTAGAEKAFFGKGIYSTGDVSDYANYKEYTVEVVFKVEPDKTVTPLCCVSWTLDKPETIIGMADVNYDGADEVITYDQSSSYRIYSMTAEGLKQIYCNK